MKTVDILYSLWPRLVTCNVNLTTDSQTASHASCIVFSSLQHAVMSAAMSAASARETEKKPPIVIKTDRCVCVCVFVYASKGWWW